MFYLRKENGDAAWVCTRVRIRICVSTYIISLEFKIQISFQNQYNIKYPYQKYKKGLEKYITLESQFIVSQRITKIVGVFLSAKC